MVGALVTGADVRLRSGNQMVVEGALRAGCRFFSGYPITPASEIYREATVTGSAHNKDGALKKNDPETIEVLRHLEAKVTAHAGEMALAHVDLEEGAETLVLSYGITSRAAGEAVRTARARGQRVSFVRVESLFPVPLEPIRKAATGARRSGCCTSRRPR